MNFFEKKIILGYMDYILKRFLSYLFVISVIKIVNCLNYF